MHEVLVNSLGGLSLPRKSVVRLTDRPDMTLDVYRGRKTTMQRLNDNIFIHKLCHKGLIVQNKFEDNLRYAVNFVCAICISGRS